MESVLESKAGRTPTIVYGILWGGLAAVSLLFLYTFLSEKLYYLDSDVFYYVSVSESLAEEGLFLDSTTDPPVPPRTPQNAVVGLHLLLGKLLTAPEHRLQALVVINYIALLLSLYPLMKIAGRMGITRFPARLALGAIYLGGWHMIRFQLPPINDGLFRTGSLWLIWGLLLMAEAEAEQKEGPRLSRKGLWVFVIVLCAALIHFRLNAVIIPLAGGAASLGLRRWRLLGVHGLLTAVMLLSLVLVYAFLEMSRIQDEFQQSWTALIRVLPLHIWDFFNTTLPAALFRDLGTTGNLLYAGFAAALVAAFAGGFQKRGFPPLFLALICLGTFCFMILYMAVPYRMLLMVYPLLYILIFSRSALRPIGYLFAFAVFMQSFLYYHAGLDLPATLRFWVYSSRHVEVEEEAMLITDKPRQAWYFIHHSAQKDNAYTTADLLGIRPIYLAGPREFVESQKLRIEELVSPDQFTVRYRPFIPEYSEELDHAFLKVQIEKAPLPGDG